MNVYARYLKITFDSSQSVLIDELYINPVLWLNLYTCHFTLYYFQPASLKFKPLQFLIFNCPSLMKLTSMAVFFSKKSNRLQWLTGRLLQNCWMSSVWSVQLCYVLQFIIKAQQKISGDRGITDILYKSNSKVMFSQKHI